MKDKILNNKKTIIVIAVVLVAVVIFGLLLNTFVCRRTQKLSTQDQGQYIYSYIDTTITCTSDDNNLNKKVNEDSSRVLQGIFNKIVKVEMESQCKVSGDIYVTIPISDEEVKTYYLADDGCNIVKYNNEYYRISVSDRFIVNDIFEKYGVTLPDYDEDTNTAHNVTIVE